MRKRRRLFAITFCGVLISLLITAVFVPTYTNFYYFCENTGSRKEHRKWIVGLESHHRQHTSDLETFMRADHPTLLKNRWSCFSSGDHHIFPIKCSGGSSIIGPISFLDLSSLNKHLRSPNKFKKLNLYQTFASADEDAIHRTIFEILDNL